MTARRRKWILAVTLLGLAAVVWCLGRGGGSMEVKLIFLGYTNYDEDMPDVLSGEGEVKYFSRLTPYFQALVLVTNSGSVTVELYPRSYQVLYATNVAGPEMLDYFVRLSPLTQPSLLKPGESVVMTTRPDNFYEPWFTAIQLLRRGLKDRLCQKLLDRYGPRTPRMAGKILSPPAEEFVSLGPITSQPP